MSYVAKYLVKENTSIRKVTIHMNIHELSFVTVVNNINEVMGVFTLGDFKNAVFKGIDIDQSIKKITNRKYKYIGLNTNEKIIKNIFKSNNITHLPIINKKKLVDVITRTKLAKKTPIPLLVMAGGKGTRLDPFTKVIPKPLIPFENEAIIKTIIDRFKYFGVKETYISLNNKADMIRAYFKSISYNHIKFINEKKELGTIGSISLLKNKIKKPFFITNCDVIIKYDYNEIYNFHKKGNFDLTMVCAYKEYNIPYGVCEIDKKGNLKKIKEKPKMDFLVNTGMYILNPKIIDFVKKNTKIDMNELIEILQKKNIKIGTFPIPNKSWLDIGNLDSFRELSSLNSINT